MKRFSYTFAYLVLLGIPSFALFYIVRDSLNFKSLILVIIFTFFVGGVFDIWATKQNKKDKFFIWEYNSKSILGFKFFGVPVEDYFLFFFLTPIFVITIYESLKKIFAAGDFLFSALVILGIIFMAVSYNFVYRHAIKSKK